MLGVQALDVLCAERLEFVEVEAGEPPDLILREGDAERIAVRFQVNLANRHEELLRREPSAGIHDDVAGPPRNGVHDETIDSAEFFPLVVPDFHVIEIERLVIE